MKSQNTKSSAELKHEVREELKKVEKSIDDFQGRMTPGQILDDIIFYPNGGSPRRTLKYLKDNPIGTSLLSMGTILLMEDENKGSFEKKVKSKIEEGAESLKSKTSDPRIGEFKSNLRTKVNDLRRSIAHSIPEKESIESIDSRNLLVLGAGLGAMTAASFPLSEREEEFFSRSDMDSALNEFEEDLKTALNEGTNTFKNLLVKEVGLFDINLF